MNINQIINILREFHDFSEQYQVDDEALDYYANQLLELGDTPCYLSLDDACEQFNLPKKMMRLCTSNGVISNPITHLDKAFLERLLKVFGKAWFVRPQLIKFNKRERARLLDAPEFQNIWERRVYYWYLAQPKGLKDERNQPHRSTTLPVNTVLTALFHFSPSVFTVEAKQWMYELMQKKGWTLYEPVETDGKVHRRKRNPPSSFLSLKTRVHKIRKKAQSDYSYDRKKGMTHEQILSARGITETDLKWANNAHKNFVFDPETRTTNDIFEPEKTPNWK